MPSQRLVDRFEIITRISSGILQVYLARERSSKNDALVREFPVEGSAWKEEEIADKAKARLAELEPGIDLTHFADADLSPDKRKAWLVVWAVKDAAVEAEIVPAATTDAPTAEQTIPPTPAAPAEPKVGEFTQMFTPPPKPARHIQTAEPISLVGSTAPPPQALRNVPTPPAKPMDSGEFTRMFGAPVVQSDTMSVKAPSAPAPTEPAAPAANTAGTPAKPNDEIGNILDLFHQGTATKQASTEPPSAKPTAEPGAFTQLFANVPKPAEPAAAALKIAPAAEKSPAPPAVKPVAPVVPAKQDAFGEFTRTFGAPPQAPMGEAHAEPNILNANPFDQFVKPAPPVKKEEPGAFTQIFSGPKLTGPDPALKGPARQANPMNEWRTPAATEPPKNAPGEFTQMFQNPTGQPSIPSTNLPTPSQNAPVFPSQKSEHGPGGLTGLFTMKTPPSHEAPQKDPFASFAPAQNPAATPESLTQLLSRAPEATPTPANPPGTPARMPVSTQPGTPANPVAPQVVSSDATYAFHQPTPQPPQVSPPPTGPSEYTRIISAPQRQAPPAPTPPPPQAPASASGGVLQNAMPQVSGPQVSAPQFSAPQFSAPQIAGPQFSAPQTTGTQFTAPAMQPISVQAPQVSLPTFQLPTPSMPSAPTEKKAMGGYLPLFIILNVLVILAILLVAYFALKHH
jgi:hypothetical protein